MLISYYVQFIASTYMYKLLTFIIIIGFINLFLKYDKYIILLFTIEFILIAISIFFIWISLDIDNNSGIIFGIYIIIIGATESAIGLSILMLHYKHKK